jgi:hypothetical protein
MAAVGNVCLDMNLCPVDVKSARKCSLRSKCTDLVYHADELMLFCTSQCYFIQFVLLIVES